MSIEIYISEDNRMPLSFAQSMAKFTEFGIYSKKINNIFKAIQHFYRDDTEIHKTYDNSKLISITFDGINSFKDNDKTFEFVNNFFILHMEFIDDNYEEYNKDKTYEIRLKNFIT